MMSEIAKWITVAPYSWTYSREECECEFYAYKLTALPDFSEPRFVYLNKEPDARRSEVIKRQMAMLRRFHTLKSDWGISLRLIKSGGRIQLYIIFRHATSQSVQDSDAQAIGDNLDSLLLREYSFVRVEEDELNEILDVSWAGEIAEIRKPEKVFTGDMYPDGTSQTFYVPFMWQPVDNVMESICAAMVSQQGAAEVEVTIVPTNLLEQEKQWINISIDRLRESMNGETIKDPDTNKTLWTGRKLPILKTPVDNFEKLYKQYEESSDFLTAIRVFSESNAEILAHAYVNNSVKNESVVETYPKGSEGYVQLIRDSSTVDVTPETHSTYWQDYQDIAPFRAQRLAKLACVEEITSFFRIPIPVKPGFPGFGFDTGIKTASGIRNIEINTIQLGSYLDDPGKSNVSAELNVQHFAKHGLIVGVPGSGKTTAMFNILYQLWALPKDKRIPFIVLEPAKTEYRALKNLELFKDDMLVFTLGDESTSPFRFNPMEVPQGVKLETHISKLQACFAGAFNLFPPLPIFLEQAIRRTYREKGWYDDNCGGDPGVETPTLSDLCRSAEYIVSNSEFDDKMRSDFKASLLERLNSLRRGAKGRMLDTKISIPMQDLMNRPVILELDGLNGDEKSLMMMFLLSYVYEYCKVHRKSGSPLKHMLLVEEAHNLISSQMNKGEEGASNSRRQSLELFINMLAEMRALGQGILIADQLPTAVAPQALKQTNVKILMRLTARDDREEIGNTMDLNEEQMHQVVNFKTGYAYLYHEGEDRVRMIRMVNFKENNQVEEPPSDPELRNIMVQYEKAHSSLYRPFKECAGYCDICDRRVRNQAEHFVDTVLLDPKQDFVKTNFRSNDDEIRAKIKICSLAQQEMKKEKERITERYEKIGDHFGACVYIHMLNKADKLMESCKKTQKSCKCSAEERNSYCMRFEFK